MGGEKNPQSTSSCVEVQTSAKLSLPLGPSKWAFLSSPFFDSRWNSAICFTAVVRTPRMHTAPNRTPRASHPLFPSDQSWMCLYAPESIPQACSLSKRTTASKRLLPGGRNKTSGYLGFHQGWSLQGPVNMTTHQRALAWEAWPGYLKHVPLPTLRQVEPAPLRVWCVHVIHITLHLLGKEFLCLVKHLLESQWEVEEETPINDQCACYGTFYFITKNQVPTSFPQWHLTAICRLALKISNLKC